MPHSPLATLLALLILVPDCRADPVQAASGAVSRVLTRDQCLLELDAAVALATNETASNKAVIDATGSRAASIDRQAVDQRFAALEAQCPDLPQLAHDRGVLAAKADRWPEAIGHFQRSLMQDERAAMTYRHLQQIFEHRAALAYARALGTTVDVPEPALEWQDSADVNQETDATDELISSLQTISTLEYELFAWWQSLHNGVGLDEHYVDSFPSAAIALSRQDFASHQWADLQREISFTARDAVVIISDVFEQHTLMLLRVVGTRWKIYQETRL